MSGLRNLVEAAQGKQQLLEVRSCRSVYMETAWLKVWHSRFLPLAVAQSQQQLLLPALVEWTLDWEHRTQLAGFPGRARALK